MKKPQKLKNANKRSGLTMALAALSAGLVFSATQSPAQTAWIGTNADFNYSTNWNGTYIDVGTSSPNPNCTDDNGSNSTVLIQPGDPIWYHGDTLAGNANNTSGAYIQTGSTNNTGYPNNGNWLRMGIGTGSVGYYTLSNGTVNVAGRTQLGEKGVGFLDVENGVYNTGYNGNPGLVAGQGDFSGAAGSTGTLVLDGGTINNIGNETWFGEAYPACIGYFYMNGGTFNANNWFVFGRNGGQGYGVMTAGTINFHGGGMFLVGGGGVGSLAQSGGIINAYNQYLVPQSNGGGTGTGTNILSGTAVLNIHDWLAVGRNGGYGEMDISGNAAVTRDNASDSGSHFTIGSGGTGVVNQNGGTVTESTSDLWVGESATGTWNLNSGTANLLNVIMSFNSGITSYLNLNGGLLAVNSISSSSSASVSTLNLNGGTLRANLSNSSFISGLFSAYVGGPVTIDSQGYSVTIPQVLQDNGGGSIIKVGSGTLNLTGVNTYTGSTTVSAGSLGIVTGTSANGGYGVADGASLNVQVVGSVNSTVNMSSLTLSNGSPSMLIDLGSFGNPTTAPVTVNALNVNGNLTININDELPQIGQFPLISYTTKTGSTYVLGPLPVGLVANLVDDTANHSIDLDITAVNIPHWDGLAGGNWDVGVTTNWLNLPTGLPTYFEQGNLVTFDDTATGTTNVNVVGNVNPGSTTFNNNLLTYTLSGSGSIGGAGSLVAEGTGLVNLYTTNTYTGPTLVSSGTLSVNSLANGGSPSSIGASSANPTNLVLSDATLRYTGPATLANRGYSLQNTNCLIDTESNLALSGAVSVVSAADFSKSGPAMLTFASVGVNQLSGSAGLGFRTIAGTTIFDGSAGGQTNNIGGHFGVGGLGGTNAAVILTNTVVNVPTGGVDLGRSGGATGTLFVNNGAVFNSTGGNMALGDGGGVASTGVVNQVGGTVISTGQIFVGQNTNGVGVYNLSGGTFEVFNWLAVGRDEGTGTFNLTGGVLYDGGGGGGNIDIGTSAGIGGVTGYGVLNQTGGVITNTASQTWLGEGTTGEPATGIWNISGGSAYLGELHVGVGGNGTNVVNLDGSGLINCAGFMGLSLNSTSVTGIVNLGSVTQPGGTLVVNNDMTVGDQGNGVLNLVANGGGQATITGTLYLSRSSATAYGIVNLNTGAVLNVSYVNNGWGFGVTHTNNANPNAFNFNGGTLKAHVGSPYFMQPYVNAQVQAGGAIIDDGGYTIDVLAALQNGGGGGGLTKLGSGSLHLDGVNTYTGETLVSAGSLGVGPGGAIAGPVSVASGAALLGDIGSIGLPFSINNTLTLSNGCAVLMQVTPSSNDQINGLTTVSYGGALVVTNASASPLVSGKQYLLFNAANAGTGNFSSVTVLSATGQYTGSFNPANGLLTIAAVATPKFNPVSVSSGNLVMTGTGGTANGTYSILTSTNIQTPLALWITNSTGLFDGSGNFSNAIPVKSSVPEQFFQLKTP